MMTSAHHLVILEKSSTIRRPLLVESWERFVGGYLEGPELIFFLGHTWHIGSADMDMIHGSTAIMGPERVKPMRKDQVQTRP